MRRFLPSIHYFAPLFALQAGAAIACATGVTITEDYIRQALSESLTVENMCKKVRDRGWCAEDCEAKSAAIIERIAAEEKNAEQEKAAEEKLIADLRAGRVKPANFEQRAIAMNAKEGYGIAKSPKVKPDGQLYVMSGTIEWADDGKPFFLGKQVGLVMGGLSSARFAVAIPKSLEKYYYDNASLNSSFNVIGRYTQNTTYKVYDGSERKVPVLEAVQFEIAQ